MAIPRTVKIERERQTPSETEKLDNKEHEDDKCRSGKLEVMDDGQVIPVHPPVRLSAFRQHRDSRPRRARRTGRGKSLIFRLAMFSTGKCRAASG